MNMNRRKLFGFLAASPIGVAVAARASAASIQNHTITLAEMPPQGQPVTIPLGYILDMAHLEPDYTAVTTSGHTHAISDPGHSHSWTTGAPARTVVRRKIYDGEKFVDFDGYEGAAVMNRVMADLRAAK